MSGHAIEHNRKAAAQCRPQPLDLVGLPVQGSAGEHEDPLAQNGLYRASMAGSFADTPWEKTPPRPGPCPQTKTKSWAAAS